MSDKQQKQRIRLTPKKMIGASIKLVLAFVVLAFLGLQSYNFFVFVFPADQWYYAFLGFGLTSGGVVGYLLIFMTDADTYMRKTIAFVMMVVSVLGEIATAGFGMQVEAWQQMGTEMAASDFNLMIWAVRILGFAHGAALLLYYAGDKIFELFQDEDGDGTPNVIDRDWKPKQTRVFAEEVQNKETNPTRERE